MKKLLSLSAFILALGLLTFVACKKEEITTQSEKAMADSSPLALSNDEIEFQAEDNYPILEKAELVDGRLKFATKEDFQETIELILANQKHLNGIENQFSGFTSQQQAFAQLTEEHLVASNGSIERYKTFAAIVEDEEGEKYLERVVDAKSLRYVVNQEGLLQIGEEVYKFNRDETYTFDQSLLPVYYKYKDRLNGTKLSGFKIEKIVRNNFDSKERWVVVHAATNYPNSSSKKISTQIEQIYVPVIALQEARAQVRNLKQGFLGIWYRTDADWISLNGNINSFICRGFNCGIESPFVTDFQTNVGEISEVANFTSIFAISAMNVLGGIITGQVKSGTTTLTCVAQK